MRRHVQPAVEDKPGEPTYRKRARVSKTATGLTRARIDVSEDDPTQVTREDDVKVFLMQAQRRFDMGATSEFYNRTEGLKDVLMVDGEAQWDDAIRSKRMRKKQPVVTVNRFRPMIAHVANEQRMSRPQIQVDPVGGGADVDAALIRQGLLRHIQVISDAETIFDTAFERMIEKGWSWWRVVTDYESELSHNQVIKIEGFSNDFAVYSDPTAEDPTRKDMKWAFIVYDMPRGEYIDTYPKSKACGLTNFTSVGDTAVAPWITADTVRVAEYYYMAEEHVNSVRLIGGDGVWEDQIEERDGLWYKKAELKLMEQGRMDPEQVQPVPVHLDENGELITRPSVRTRPMWCKINAIEILDGDQGADIESNTCGRRIAGKYIPLVMVSGIERTIKGQRRLAGMVRTARDIQRIYNYLAAKFVETVALSPKSPYIAEAEQIADYKKMWDQSNEENYAVLLYKARTIGTQAVPPPQRQNIEPPVVALLQGLNTFDMMLKATFNIYDPSLGTAKADQSGRAIAGLQSRSDAANMNWMDNQRRAEVYTGEIILEMMPEIYDTARIVTIVRAKDDKKVEVQINQEFMDKETKKPVHHDIAVGKFSCTISLGQWASKRQQTVSSLTDIAKNVPQVALVLLPLILDNMDSPMARDAAELIKRMQPPEMQEPDSPEGLQAKFRAMMQQHQMLVEALNRANETIKTKQLDLASKEYVEGLRAQAAIIAAGMKAGNAESLQQATQEFERIQKLLDLNHERILSEQQQAHEVGLAAMEAANQPAEGATA